ncbi:MAG: hypothetical protein WC367_00485 [Methanoregula sp.]|jgi:hypothetical protein
MSELHANEKVKVEIFGTAVKATYSATDTKQIQKVIRDKLLLTEMEPYFKVDVVVKHKPNGKPEALIAYMLRAYTYTADVVRLDIDEQYNVRSIEKSYVDTVDEFAEIKTPDLKLKIPHGGLRPLRMPDMVFATPVPEIATAKAGVETAYKIATSAGYKAIKLLGKDANLANYKRYLSGHLKAFGSIGHGYTGGIVLSDGNLTSQWFSSLTRAALKPEVIYFNSCQVFNPPLEPSIIKAGARTFVGGKINLLIGPSEEVFKCFWEAILKKKAKMGPALIACEKQKYPVQNAHGIAGDLGPFLPIPK